MMERFRLKSLFWDYKNYQVQVIFDQGNFPFLLGSEDEKLKFAFKIYDINGDGYISNGELFDVLFNVII